MAENRRWPGEIPNTIRKAQERLLEQLHPDALRDEFRGILDLSYEGDGEDRIVTEALIDLTDQPFFGEITSVRLRTGPSSRRALLPRAYDFCTALFAVDEDIGPDAIQTPKYYAEKTPGIFAVFPLPTQSFEYLGIANLRCPLISADGPTVNLLTLRHATLLEYAACVEGALWMKDNAAVQIWEAAFETRLQSTNDNIRRRRRDETTVVTRNTENAAGAT